MFTFNGNHSFIMCISGVLQYVCDTHLIKIKMIEIKISHFLGHLIFESWINLR